MTTKSQKTTINEDKARDFFLSSNFSEDNDSFTGGEGQLSCDVYQNEDNIIVKSAMAGVDPKNLNISISNDLLTIRGYREEDSEIKDNNYFAREVYWGAFSRSIVLPQEINQNKVKASLKKGILTIILPKKYKNTSIQVESIED
ncbi:Hsp20/alpha crystallin family protein [Candidatus Falkowbacteria bacterium]|uniref:Molecular chaperone n=1 Tax=Candidatus Buchananbacteria bacterium CG10_big_fil_rev_8_21_14_0_10_33_19 TaxID=1974525 RepID=A0A2H0W6Z5_9BACT|nr:Hsp20/alpha crystallin family protein [Candidatus Falkowbacteria bacterium]PIS06361.1 MAG: molecular chaperone [Candidatus Buchananbacteria bacterium CG10_big_fil_rev_8_21_14_0_10_33_19]